MPFTLDMTPRPYIDKTVPLRDNDYMRANQPEDRLSGFERAVCYNTIPRVAAPVTLSLVFVYAFCLLEAVLALAYGLTARNQSWATAGAAALAVLVVFGMVAFFIRALVNDARQRFMLAEAHLTPEPSPVNDIPDPFAGHLLFKRPAEPTGDLFACTSDEGAMRYSVEVRRRHRHWRVCTGVDLPEFDVLAFHGVRSFEMFPGRSAPYRAGVYRNNLLLAEIQRRFSWTEASTQITAREGGAPWVFIHGGIYHHERLVGRIYEVRSWLYLDIETDHATEGVLALFLTLE